MTTRCARQNNGAPRTSPRLLAPFVRSQKRGRYATAPVLVQKNEAHEPTQRLVVISPLVRKYQAPALRGVLWSCSAALFRRFEGVGLQTDT